MPSLRLRYVMPLAHGANAPPSSEHANVEPVSVAEKVNEAAVAATDPLGPVTMVVSGGVVSSATTSD